MGDYDDLERSGAGYTRASRAVVYYASICMAMSFMSIFGSPPVTFGWLLRDSRCEVVSVEPWLARSGGPISFVFCTFFDLRLHFDLSFENEMALLAFGALHAARAVER